MTSARCLPSKNAREASADMWQLIRGRRCPKASSKNSPPGSDKLPRILESLFPEEKWNGRYKIQIAAAERDTCLSSFLLSSSPSFCVPFSLPKTRFCCNVYEQFIKKFYPIAKNRNLFIYICRHKRQGLQCAIGVSR